MGQAASAGTPCGSCGHVAPNPNPAQPSLKTVLLTMGLGLLSTILGSALIYLEGYKPYRDALDGAPKVEISFSAALMAPFFTIIGLIMLVPFPKASKDGTNLLRKIFQWIALGALVLGLIAGIVGYFWLRLFLKDKGYAF